MSFAYLPPYFLNLSRVASIKEPIHFFSKKDFVTDPVLKATVEILCVVDIAL